ncbi:MAG: rRNA maturation RNase YbeY [Kiritimatiellae bacterium]|nr:rRNA maturation RNase YbeY [Kiritimatiellia bacterium]
MKTKIFVAQPQKIASVSTPNIKKLAAWLLDQAAVEFPGFQLSELSIALVNDDAIAPINEQFMKHSGTTDVITFTLAPPPGESHASGEIVINLQRAIEEAKRRRGKPEREFAWYLAHGIDHLTGATDHTPVQRAAMHRREKRWLNAAARAGLTQEILR